MLGLVGDLLDAVVLRPRLASGTKIRLRAWGAVTLIDRGLQDAKLVCSPYPLAAFQCGNVSRFFRFYAKCKGLLNYWRRRPGRNAYGGWRSADEALARAVASASRPNRCSPSTGPTSDPKAGLHSTPSQGNFRALNSTPSRSKVTPIDSARRPTTNSCRRNVPMQSRAILLLQARSTPGRSLPQARGSRLHKPSLGTARGTRRMPSSSPAYSRIGVLRSKWWELAEHRAAVAGRR